MATRHAIVVGAGFGGLATAALLARDGFSVTVVEKNEMAGGRARIWEKDGFVFDMGPSWYLMPEVFEAFFEKFDRKRKDYYDLERLNPYYRIYFSPEERVDITSNMDANRAYFEGLEAGGAERLDQYLQAAGYKYNVAMREFMEVEYTSVTQFLNRRMMTEGLKLDMFSPLDKYVRRFFNDRRARQILEYPMVFLGNSPHNAPALYSIMSHVDFNLGVWYPKGGMGQVVNGFKKLSEEFGVNFIFNSPVEKIVQNNGQVRGVSVAGEILSADCVIVNADYAFSETQMIAAPYQSYPDSYWSKKVVAPSMLLGYLGLNKKVDSLAHHTLFFAEDWDHHFRQIFDDPAWPDNPCYYIGTTSRSDPTTAPEGCENLFLLIPAAPDLPDTPEIREAQFDRGIRHLEQLIQEPIRDHIIVKRLFAMNDFRKDYNAYKGTALGMAHTLNQTAVFRPAHRSKKIGGLYYNGHYTHPGVGVPIVIISAQITAELIHKDML
jgi:1-hydroxy-2-isopentenylcarotenoid 3,4-desaturase